MVIFLTSSPTGDLDGKYICAGLDNRNGFVDELREFWRDNARVLLISATPDMYEHNDEMCAFFREAIETSGLSVSDMDVWDYRILENYDWYSADALHSYDVIILGGGHVPTENEFFQQLFLRHNIRSFDGIVIGISAGTMNCADVVYAQPEEPGEAIDPDYERFIEGLGITQFNILPHYQIVKDNIIDGLRLYEDITLPDSEGNMFIALPDGSFMVDFYGETRIANDEWIDEGEPVICGEAYIVRDGEIEQVSEEGDWL